MAVPSSYLTSFKNVDAILASIQSAQAPQRFTTRFLADLGYPSAADRLIIGVLKALGMLSDTGQPTSRYFEFLDPSQAGRVMAEGMRDAYSDLFQIRTDADQMSAGEIKNKLKTLSQGQYSDSVLQKMSGTFKALAKHADFGTTIKAKVDPELLPEDVDKTPEHPNETPRLAVRGLVYNINLHLPESRDQAVYDALFRSLREHLS